MGLFKGLFLFFITNRIIIGVSCQNTSLLLEPVETVVIKNIGDSYFINCYGKNASDFVWLNPKNVVITGNIENKIHTGARMTDTGVSNDGISLSFRFLELSNKGNYTCKAKLNGTEVRTSFTLIVVDPPKFKDTSEKQSAVEGENFLVRCEASGDPEPKISWTITERKTGQTKAINDRYNKLADGLSISKVTKEDSMLNFACKAVQVDSLVSNMEIRVIRLNVLYKPKLIGYRTTTLYGYLGGTTNITCEVDANPEANITFYRSDQRILGDGNATTVIYQPNKWVLKIHNVTKSVFGEYKCFAKNERGSVERVFILKEGPKPQPPKKVEHSTTHNSLKLEIHAPEDKELEITGFRVQILEKMEKEKGRGWEVAREIELPKGKDNTYVITDLKPNTEYVVRVTSQNAAGAGDYRELKPAKTSSSSSSFSSSSALITFLIVIVYFNWS